MTPSDQSATFNVSGCEFADDLFNLSTNPTVASSLLYSTATTALIVGIMPTLSVFGICANMSFLYVVYRARQMRTFTNAYLSNLAVADIAFLLSATIPAVYQYSASDIISDQLSIGEAGCAIVNAFIFLFFYASVFLVTLVSFERYGAVCRPFRHRISQGKKRTVKRIVCAWVTSVVFASFVIPSLTVMKKTCVIWPEGETFADLPSVIGDCTPVAEWVYYFGNGCKMVPFFASMFFIGYLYTRIIIELRKKMPGLAHRRRYNASVERVLRSRKQIAIMLITTGVIFFVCQAPAQIITLINMITRGTKAEPLLNQGQRGIVQWFSRLLLFINSAINPIIYNVTNSRYRQAFGQIFDCCSNTKMLNMNKRKRNVKGIYVINGEPVNGSVIDNNNIISLTNMKQTPQELCGNALYRSTCL